MDDTLYECASFKCMDIARRVFARVFMCYNKRGEVAVFWYGLGCYNCTDASFAESDMPMLRREKAADCGQEVTINEVGVCGKTHGGLNERVFIK